MKVTIKNNGPLNGNEVPQLYIDFPAGAGEPNNQLRGFTKVMIANGAGSAVYFGLNTRHLSVWEGQWNLVHGQYNVYVGASSRDIRVRGSFTI
jgi:beta-glucosidase